MLWIPPVFQYLSKSSLLSLPAVELTLVLAMSTTCNVMIGNHFEIKILHSGDFHVTCNNRKHVSKILECESLRVTMGSSIVAIVCNSSITCLLRNVCSKFYLFNRLYSPERKFHLIIDSWCPLVNAWKHSLTCARPIWAVDLWFVAKCEWFNRSDLESSSLHWLKISCCVRWTF